jgi:hypothetical protein
VESRSNRYRAFGVDLLSEVPIVGLRDGQAPIRSATSITLVPSSDLEEDWAQRPRVRMVEDVISDGRLGYAIDWDETTACILLSGATLGSIEVDLSGQSVRLGTPLRTDWESWLLGQVLPMVAVLRGMEPLHASAVRIGDTTVGVAGTPGAGKSSIALRLMLMGGELLTDDVLALERDGDHVIAHPGHALVKVRPAELALLAEDERATIGVPQATEEDGSVQFRVASGSAPAHLSGMYFLERPGGAGTIEFLPLAPMDPRPLLAHTFNFLIGDPERLRRQLDVAAAVAASCDVARVTVPEGVTADDVALAILERVDQRIP